MRRSSFTFVLAIWTSLYVCGVAFAQTQAVIERIGDVSITILAPSSGFTDTRHIQGDTPIARFVRDAPSLFKYPNSQTIAVYLSTDDVAVALAGNKTQFSRYFFITTPADLTTRSVSQQEFQEGASKFREAWKEGGPLLEGARAKTEPELAAALGVFQDDQTSIGAASLNKISRGAAALNSGSIAIGAEKTELIYVTAVILMLLKGKMIGLRVDSALKSRADIEWVKAEASKWRSQLVSAN